MTTYQSDFTPKPISQSFGLKPSKLRQMTAERNAQRNDAIARELALASDLIASGMETMPAVAFAAGVGGGLAETDALAPARGIKNGLGFSVVLYAIIIVLVVLVGKNLAAAVEQERLSSQENFSSYRTAGVVEPGR